MHRPRGRVVLALVFALFALNGWVQVVLAPLGRTGDPGALTLLQAIVGTAAAAAAWGSWAGTRWAPWAALLYGLLTAGMLVALGPLLDLPAEAQHGIWIGAGVVMLFAAASAWYLRRAVALEPPGEIPREIPPEIPPGDR
jgi:hypothetical protein